jgi:hypothetical protein
MGSTMGGWTMAKGIKLNEADLTIKGKRAKAIRCEDGFWRIAPVSFKVTQENAFRNLRDLRAAVRKANRS